MTRNLLIAIACFVGLSVAERRAEATCQTYQWCDYDGYYWYYCYDYTYDSATGQYGCAMGHDNANKHVLYFHGRSMNGVPAAAMTPTSALPADWDSKSFYYEGNDNLTQAATQTVKNALRTYCTGGHYCALVMISSAHNRVLSALNLLEAEGTPATGVLWAEAIVSAAGGAPVSRYTTKAGQKFVARLYGEYAHIDEDLHDTKWASWGMYGNLQNKMPVATFHLGAGLKDQCTKHKILGGLLGKVKVCGNKYNPGGLGDGAVPVYSACGYADQGAHYSCTEAGYKYAMRTHDSWSQENYPQYNHSELIAVGLGLVSSTRVPASVAVTFTNSAGQIQTGGPEVDCNPAFWDCDHSEADGQTWFYVYQGFQNGVYQNLRPFTCGACNVYGLGDATYTGEDWYYNYDDYWCQYYFECYAYPIYYWSVQTTWGQAMTCYSSDPSGNYPSCY